MRKSFDKNSNITIRELNRGDWPLYRAYYKSLSNPQHFSGYLEGKDLNDPETGINFFKDAFQAGNFILFGLFDDNQMIGQTSITFLNNEEYSNTALLAGSEITDNYRGRRLVDNFYNTRMNYLKNIGFNGDIIMSIHPDNIPSQKAAARNGFVKTGASDNYGYDLLTFAGMK